MKKTGVLWAGLVVVVLIAFLVAAGCDTGKTGSAGKAKQELVFDPKNPCNILTKEEVEAVIKQKVKDPQPQDYACTYESADSQKFTSLIFSLEDADAAGLFKGMKELFEKSGKPVKAVEGMGDGAFVYEKELHVLKGKYFFHFQSSGNKGYELDEDAIRHLARTAVDKL